jgi:hypothetical protein
MSPRRRSGRKNRVGRPKLAPGLGYSRKLALRISDDDDCALIKLAEMMRVGESEILRRALREYAARVLPSGGDGSARQT